MTIEIRINDDVIDFAVPVAGGMPADEDVNLLTRMVGILRDEFARHGHQLQPCPEPYLGGSHKVLWRITKNRKWL